MWRRVEIENFRGFERFELHDLGRVNLLVGGNNSGKTSVLEAIDLLTAAEPVPRMYATLSRRGETPPSSSAEARVDVSHLFHGHRPGAFELRATNQGTELKLRAELRLPEEQAQLGFFDDTNEDSPDGSADVSRRLRRREGRLAVWLHAIPAGERSMLVRIGSAGDMGPRDVSKFDEQLAHGEDGWGVVEFLTTRSLDARRIMALFSQIALQDDEATVIEALRTIEPGIERLGLVDLTPLNRDRGGLAVRLSGVRRRVPIGSLGDGIWRLLALTLSLVRAKGGVLLVDEIDTGLHYSVLSKMWTLVMRTAERLDVQVFATTHSRDCYESLAAICREEPEGLTRVSIQRIERGKTKAIAFTEREIILAAERGIEVR